MFAAAVGSGTFRGRGGLGIGEGSGSAIRTGSGAQGPLRAGFRARDGTEGEPKAYACSGFRSELLAV